MPDFETPLYRTEPPVATITLNRPDQLNTIVPPMPDEIEAAIGCAERDPQIKVIVLRGAGRSFSGGNDFGGGFEHWGEAMNTDGRWDPGKDFGAILDGLMRNTPEALSFIDTAASEGVRAAVERRDGPWGDYSQAPPDRRPDPSHVIEP
jgi:Enoyl-CoA hydratase/isomerase